MSFSYLISLDLYLNANQQQDYESCVNKKVHQAPRPYCEAFLEKHPAFVLWTKAQKEQECVSATQHVKGTCEQVEICDSCALLLAHVFKKYEDNVS